MADAKPAQDHDRKKQIWLIVAHMHERHTLESLTKRLQEDFKILDQKHTTKAHVFLIEQRK